MAEPRRHHFVQAEHIRQFVNDNGTVWVYSKEGKQFEVSPEAIFWKRDLNSYETPEGLNTEFETFVTDFENQTFPAIARTIETGSLAEKDVGLVTAYLALSRIRNPTLQAGIIDHHKQIVTTTAKLNERHGQFDDMPPMPGYEDKSISDLLDEGTIGFQINNSVYLERLVQMTEKCGLLFANGFRWNLVRSPRGRVILSDHPLTVCHPGIDFGPYGIPAGGENCEIAFPLSKHLYVVGLWDREFEAVESEDLVDELNKRQALFANRHIATGLKQRYWLELVFRHRNFGFQTKADTMDYGAGAYFALRASVFPLEGKPPPKNSRPLEKLKALFPKK